MTDIRDREYLEAEQQLEKRMSQVYQQVNEKKKEIRANVDLTDEERKERFAQWYGSIGQNLEDEASRFVATFENLRDDLDRRVHQGNEAVAEHLARVAELDNDALDQLMATAERTGQAELQQAIAEISLTRHRDGTFRRWAQRNPERAAALERLHNLPPTERVVSRATARATVPNANFEGLTPTQEDLERAATRKRMAEAERERSLRAPKIRRQVGSRIWEVPQL